MPKTITTGVIVGSSWILEFPSDLTERYRNNRRQNRLSGYLISSLKDPKEGGGGG